jgi:aminoglycoside phosphotransferase (APT) family kinase protein
VDARLERIARRLGEVLDETVSESGLRRLSSGASRETFAFGLPSRGALVLQIAAAGTKLSEAPPEARLLAAAAEAGVPVPAVIAHGRDDPDLGSSWWVVESLTGTTDPTAILAGDGVPEADVLLDDIARVLVAVHRMPADPQLAAPVDDALGLLREWHDQLGQPHPVFELAFRTLAADPPPPGRRTFVHGDFRMGNLMIGERGVAGVLDWELAHLGDPVEDLGWLCVPAWRFGRPDRPAAGLGSRDALLDAYERHGGQRVDTHALQWWELMSTLRWGVMCVMQAFSHLSGAIQSVEHAVIGRRTCEVEWDLLELLDPDAERPPSSTPQPGPQAGPGPPSLHDRPTMIELLDAARATLGDNVLPQLEGRPAFETRVTMRALGMIRRELIHADEHAARRTAALAALGAGSEAELATAIRQGALDGREDELCGALRTLVAAKLDVANPRYRHKETA